MGRGFAPASMSMIPLLHNAYTQNLEILVTVQAAGILNFLDFFSYMGSGLQNLRGTPQLLMMAKGEKDTKDPLPFECFFAPFSKRKSPRNDFGGKLVDLS